MDSIYLDHNATTPTRPEVVDAMARCYGEVCANPASQHRPGQQARRVLEEAREQIAQILDVDLTPPRRDRLIFTSGGTEANNLAILGFARASSPRQPAEEEQTMRAAQPCQIIVSSGEHPSVIEPAEHLLEQGWRLDTLGLTPQGVVCVEQLPPLLENVETPVRLVSVQLANHETGVLQPIGELGAICDKAGVPLHTDAVQAVGKIPVSFRSLGVAAMSVAAHKFGGPLGVGALIVRDGVPLGPLMFGGHQQAGLRPGTESAVLAVGMATALDLWQRGHAERARRLRSLRDRFEQALRAAMPNITVHGADALGRQLDCRPGSGSTTATPTRASATPTPKPDPRLPQTSNVAFPDFDGQVLLMALDLAGVACSVGSACSSGSTELSPTLRAMDLPGNLVASSLRFSFGITNTEAEIDEAVRRIVHVCSELRG
jgi:cysteine desulfurase